MTGETCGLREAGAVVGGVFVSVGRSNALSELGSTYSGAFSGCVAGAAAGCDEGFSIDERVGDDASPVDAGAAGAGTGVYGGA